MRYLQCPRCDEIDLVVEMDGEGTCAVCHTTFDAPDNIPVPCSCTEFCICNECIGAKLYMYEKGVPPEDMGALDKWEAEEELRHINKDI
jgi:hypothetical protein